MRIIGFGIGWVLFQLLFAALAFSETLALCFFGLCSQSCLVGLLSTLLFSFTLISESLKAGFLGLAMLKLSLLLFVPVLDVMEHLLFVDMRHTIVLCKLGSEECFTAARLASDRNFERLKAALFAELLLHLLDVGGKTTLAMPFESTVITITFTTFLFILVTLFFLGHEDLRWPRLDIEHDEALPVEVEVERGLLRVHRRVLKRDVHRLDKTGADTVADRLDQLLLRRLLRVVDTEDVLLLGRGL